MCPRRQNQRDDGGREMHIVRDSDFGFGRVAAWLTGLRAWDINFIGSGRGGQAKDATGH